MDITTITAAYEGLKAGKSILKSLYDSKIEADAKDKIDEVMSKLGEAQDILFSMREELFRLQAENKSLSDQLEEVDSWDNKFSEYALVETDGGAVVYQFSGSPEHFACPSCMSKKSVEILQTKRLRSGAYNCVGCESVYLIEPAKPNPPMNFR